MLFAVAATVLQCDCYSEQCDCYSEQCDCYSATTATVLQCDCYSDSCKIHVRFKLLHEECIEFIKLGLRNNVAQICVFESLNQTDTKDMSAPKSSLSGSNKVVICNIHVLYNPRRGEIKLGQSTLNPALSTASNFKHAIPPMGVSYKGKTLFFYMQLNLSDLLRDELSGQACAEIRPPKKFSPDVRAQHAHSGGGASVVVDHRELTQSGSPLVVHQQSGPERNLVNLPSISSIPQLQCVSAGSNVYVSNPHSGQSGNENGTSSPEMTKQTHHKEDGFQDETPDGGLRESLSSSQNKVGVLVDQMKERHTENIYSNLLRTKLTKVVDGFKNVFHSILSISGLRYSPISPQNEGKVSGVQRKGGDEFTSVDSRNEGLTEAEHEKQMHASIDSQSDPSFEPKVHTENKITSCEKIEVPFLSSNNTTDTIIDPTPSGTSSELFHESSCPSTLGVSTMGSSESLSSLLPAKDKDNPSNFSKVDISCEVTSTDYVIGGKMENLLLKELPETDDGDEVFGEDSTKFLSELNNGNEPFSSDFSHAVSSDFVESDKSFKETEPHVALNFRYDPSAWAPMEIETATGKSDCTLVEHPVKLRSTYAEVEDCSGTSDSNGEPQVTSYNRRFVGTVDYIWRSEGLQTVRVLAPIPKHGMQWTPGFPTKKWGSDHIALVSELAFVKGGSTQNS
ncbi:hypothetical protein Vadar_004776 [Vaccinium darrowii]|uniref:Uncharacterized protein n=1 Tax=Vaccinium darrowii TaxID=229202 RepID=A0ACB7XWQ3_9ERIC|nr:hypothetical protein Vadar_004776 [Vaccinium darrowii]